MIKKQKYRIKILKEIGPHINGGKRYLGLKACCCIVTLFLTMILPMLYGFFVEKVILGGKIKLLAGIVAGYVLVQLISTGLAFLNNFCTYTLNNKFTISARLKLLDNSFARSFSKYENINTGNEKMVFDDAVFKLCDFWGTQSIDYAINLLQTIVILTVLVFMEWHLALVMIVAIPFTIWLNHINGNLAKKNNQESWKNDRDWGAWIFSTIRAWREVRAMGLEEQREADFQEYSNRYSGLFRVYTRFWVTRRFTIPKLKEEFLMQFILYFVGGILIYKGNMTIGVLLAFSQYYKMMAESFQNVINADTDLQINSVQYDKAIDALAEEIESEDDKLCDVLNYDICIQNVSYRYPEGNTDVLKDFSLEIKQGERLGIVGESGKGKTTLLNLMVGVLTPSNGVVKIGGVNLQDLNKKNVYKKIGFVLQENVLFNTTIKENLLYGKEDATEEEIREACRKACISEYIESLPEKYDTNVGEKGIKLSGGQRQRLVLARLFLRDVDVFIFDEATSALDQHAENLIQNVICNIGEEKSIIVVAHRESSLKVCDRLVYL